MNRYRLGRKFKVDGKWYWRCLGDGSVIKTNLPEGAMCPLCHRPTDITVVEAETRTMIVKEIRFKDGRRDWLPFRTMIL